MGLYFCFQFNTEISNSNFKTKDIVNCMIEKLLNPNENYKKYEYLLTLFGFQNSVKISSLIETQNLYLCRYIKNTLEE